MGHFRSDDYSRSIQLHLLFIKINEESNAVTQKDRHEMNIDFVDQSRPNILLGNVGTTYVNIVLSGGCLRLLQRTLDAIRDKCKCCFPLGNGFSRLMREYEYRRVERRIISPGFFSKFKPATSHDRCAGSTERFLHDGAVNACGACAWGGAGSFGTTAEYPIMKMLSAFAERKFNTIVRS